MKKNSVHYRHSDNLQELKQETRQKPRKFKTTEALEEYLARGGKIRKVAYLPETGLFDYLTESMEIV